MPTEEIKQDAVIEKPLVDQNAQPPAEPPKDPPKEDPLEQKAAAEDFRTAFLKSRDKEKESQPKPDESDEPEAKSPEAKPKPKPKPEPKPAAKPEPKPDDSDEEEKKPLPFKVQPLDDGNDRASIIKDAAQAASEAAVRALKESQPEAPKVSVEDEILGDDAVYFRELESIAPDKYKDITKKVADFKVKEREYRQKWEEQNDGQDYDPNDDEHKKFYARNEPSISARDLKKAELSVIERNASEKAYERFKKENEPIERKQRRQEMEEKIQPAKAQELRSAILGAIAGLGDEFAEIAKDDEQVNRLAEIDPIAEEVLIETSQKYAPLIAAAKHIAMGDFDDQNQSHHEAFRYYRELESEMLAKPKSQTSIQFEDGIRHLVGVKEFLAMSPSQQSKHYYLTPDDLLTSIKKRYQAETKKKYQKLDELIKRRTGGGTNTASVSTPKGRTAPLYESSQVVDDEDDDKSPSAKPGSARIGAGDGKAVQEPKSMQAFRSRFLG